MTWACCAATGPRHLAVIELLAETDKEEGAAMPQSKPGPQLD